VVVAVVEVVGDGTVVVGAAVVVGGFSSAGYKTLSVLSSSKSQIRAPVTSHEVTANKSLLLSWIKFVRTGSSKYVDG
jgi:hypothetical protein